LTLDTAPVRERKLLNSRPVESWQCTGLFACEALQTVDLVVRPER